MNIISILISDKREGGKEIINWKIRQKYAGNGLSKLDNILRDNTVKLIKFYSRKAKKGRILVGITI